MIAGAVALNNFWTHRRSVHIGSDSEAEPNGDEQDHSEGCP
jgi:hypothetical protein